MSDEISTKLILASASPRRKELLEQIGVSFDICSADIDESPYAAELPVNYVLRMAKSKAYEVWSQLKQSAQLSLAERVIILASDTGVVLDGSIFGKPDTKTEFEGMMAQLSGCYHEVMTSVHVLELALSSDQPVLDIKSEKAFMVNTKVKFKSLCASEIEAYWLTGEPKDKAGGYGIQGKGAIFIERIEGSYSSVVGLPLNETAEMLVQYGIGVWS